MRTSHRSFNPFGHPIDSFDRVLSSELTNEILSKLARLHLDLLTEAGWSAGGVFIADCISSGDLLPLCDFDPDFLDLSPADAYHLRQALAFFGKRSDFDLGLDREAAALTKFREAEHACRVTNACFRAHAQGRFQFRPDVESILHAAQRKIACVLGEAPKYSNIRPRFGPGATTQVPKRNACLALKLAHAPACSLNAIDYVGSFGSLFLNDVDENGYMDVTIPVHHSKIAFVPKSAKIDRAICVEPQWNSMFQNGLGEIIARRLRRVGIDIRDQTRNQRLALYGSSSGHFGTIDLSSASDTVAIGLVQHLLPGEWFDLLSILRSATCVVNGEVLHLEKISSMGNGFTFPLETLIFWAIAQSVADLYPSRWRTVSVYGDDIIAPSDACQAIVQVLQALGFSPNAKKSFWTGGFRESCGRDYHFGVLIRPVFVTGPLEGSDVFRLHNFYAERGMSGFCSLLESLIEPSVRRYGPKGFGDGVLISDRYHARRENRKGWDGYSFESWCFKPRLLRSSIMRRFSGSKPDQIYRSDLKKRKFDWAGRHSLLVRIVATYMSEIGLPSYNADDPLVEPVPRDMLSPFAVPGRGPVNLVRIYTFEPAPA